MNIQIREEVQSDHSDVFVLNEIAFEQDGEAKLINLLRESSAFIPELSLVALIDNDIVGHILFTKITIISDNGNEYNSLALAPMAVKPSYQKQGIGGQLINYGLGKAKELGHNSVIVLGHEHYYPKFGFLPTTKWNIKAPFDVPTNAFMAIELIENGLNGITGIVKYAKEFVMV